MLRKLKKFLSGALCVAMLTSSFSYCAAAENSDDEETMTIGTIKIGNAYIPRGTILEVEISRTFSSKNFKEGDAVPLRLADNLIVNDVVVIPRFTRVKAIVTRARKAGGFGRSGKLEFKIISVKTLNGIEIPLEYAMEEKGQTDKGAIPVAIFASLVGGAFMKGSNVTIQQGTRFEAEVAADTDLEVSLKDLKAVMESNRPNSVKVTIKQ